MDHDGIQVLRRRRRDRYRVGPVDGDRRTSPSPSSGTRGWHAWAAGSPRPAPEPGTRVYELLTLRAAVRRVRLHGLRHTFATLQSVGGGAFQAVVKWLGHSSYVLTLSTYTDYIREDDTAAPELARPVAAPVTNVVDLERKKSDTTPTRWRLWARA